MGGFGDLTSSVYDAIQTQEDTERVNRRERNDTFTYYYDQQSTRKSGYIYLVCIKKSEIYSIEALPPNTDFTQITRTYPIQGIEEIEVLLMTDTTLGYCGLKDVTSVLETTDPEQVIIRYNTFDLALHYETDESNNTLLYKNQIKDLSKAGKFRLKSARLS
jgi:hypothetical protein